MGLSPGMTFNHWVLGKKLGEGACSEVYQVTRAKQNGSESQYYAMKLSPLPLVKSKLKKKKTMQERFADALYAEFLLYNQVLARYPKSGGFPSLPSSAYGEANGYRYIVLELLGASLEDVVTKFGPVDESAAAQVGLAILDALTYLHEQKHIFIDVKPENFMVNADHTLVYVVDFGIAERFIKAKGNHKELVTGGTIVGTPTFLSLNCHEGVAPSRRDDIEGLLYVLLYLIRGDLPWQDATSDADGAKKKRATSLSDLCAGFSNKWIKMVEKIRSCDFDAVPQYDFFVNQLKSIGGAAKAHTQPFGWAKKGGKTTTTTTPVRSKKKTKAVARKPPVAKTSAASKKTTTSTKSRRAKVKEVVEIEDDVSPEVSPVVQKRRQPSRRATAAAQKKKQEPIVIDDESDESPAKRSKRAEKTALAAAAAVKSMAQTKRRSSRR